MCQDHKRTIYVNFLRKLREESLKIVARIQQNGKRILRALARLDDFLSNPLFQGHSGTAPETSRNVFSIDQRANEDDFQSNPHPEAGIFNGQMMQNAGPEDRHDTIFSAFVQ